MTNWRTCRTKLKRRENNTRKCKAKYDQNKTGNKLKQTRRIVFFDDVEMVEGGERGETNGLEEMREKPEQVSVLSVLPTERKVIDVVRYCRVWLHIAASVRTT